MKTTDRELLELAAKAAGLADARWDEFYPAVVHTAENGLRDCPWNPLANDAEAFRLAVKLAIDIRLFGSSISGWTPSGREPWAGTSVDRLGRGFNEPCSDDPYAAARRAIVRAAAEIGSAA